MKPWVWGLVLRGLLLSHNLGPALSPPTGSSEETSSDNLPSYIWILASCNQSPLTYLKQGNLYSLIYWDYLKYCDGPTPGKEVKIHCIDMAN